MAVLTNMEIENFIKYAEEQLYNERILYESRIISAVEKLQEETEISIENGQFYSQQWMLLSIPQLQESKSSIRSHHEQVMMEKFEYYNKSKNYDGMYIWIDALLRNIGFTNNQADRLIVAINKIGEKIYSRTN